MCGSERRVRARRAEQISARLAEDLPLFAPPAKATPPARGAEPDRLWSTLAEIDLNQLTPRQPLELAFLDSKTNSEINIKLMFVSIFKSNIRPDHYIFKSILSGEFFRRAFRKFDIKLKV